MRRIWNILMLLLLSTIAAVGCDGRRSFDNQEAVAFTSQALVLSELTYPLSSMTAWTDTNYGACGSAYFSGLCHNGADIGASVGTPVYAIAAGTVIAKSDAQNATCSSGWGRDQTTGTCNMALAIRHYDASGLPFIAIYGHLRDSTSIHVGTAFNAGQQIGAIGSWPYGDHLHFGIIPGTSVPNTGWGRMPCAGSQDPSLTFPSGCSTNGFLPPGTFITQHFSSSAPFSHHDAPTVCADQPTPNGSWYYSCYAKSLFEAGEPVWVLLRLYDVTTNHQFRVKAYKDEAYQWDWPTDMIYVSGTWQYSHFWPELIASTAGQWRFDLFVVPAGQPEIYVDSASFRVFPQGTLYEQGGGGLSFDYPGVNYAYDGNGHTCSGPIEGSQATNWVYTCGTPRATFDAGETVNALVRIDNIYANFRFSTAAYKNGVYQWSTTTGWNNVGQWGWSKYYYPITMQGAQPGNWEFRVSADEGYGFEVLDTMSFIVSPPPPYQYDGDLITCRGPVTGDASTNWIYTCNNPTSTFNVNDPAAALVRIDNIVVNFRWQVGVYLNGTYQWGYSTDWNNVGQWGWDKAYFAPTTGAVWATGNWEYKLYVDSGSGFQYVDSAYFTVN